MTDVERSSACLATVMAMVLAPLASCASAGTKPLVHRLDCTYRKGGDFRLVFDLAKDQIWILESDMATEQRRVDGRANLVLRPQYAGGAQSELEIADTGEATVKAFDAEGAVVRSEVAQCR